MDICCSTCREPWDTDHLQEDEIYEVVSESEALTWLDLPRKEQLSPHYREKFKEAGWEFGHTIINVIRCPACPSDAEPDPILIQVKSDLEDLLGDDEDGLAASFEDLDL